MVVRTLPREDRDAVLLLARSGLDWRTFAMRTMPALARRVGTEAWCLATCDPSSLLMTGVVVAGGASPDPRFFELEYGVDDYISQRELARTVPHVGVLSRVTEDRLERSVRWRELLEPFGLGDQLRAALVSRQRCWGYVAMMREGSDPAFGAKDADLVSHLGPALAEGLRLAHLTQEASGAAGAPAAVLILSGTLTVVAKTGAVEELLGETVHVGGSPPLPVMGVASEAAVRANGALASARVRTGGRWLTVQATRLVAQEGGEEIAVMIHAPHAPEVVEVVLAAWGLTRREAEIVRLTLTGSPTSEIAGQLHVSALTVQQHLKSIFEKVGVRSRRELVARVFEQHYRPGIATGNPMSDP